MTHYMPPLDDIRFNLEHVIGLDRLPDHDDLGKLDIEMIDSILEPASKLASEVLAPLNWSGDQEGATLKDGIVTTASGFKDAYHEYINGGWNAVPFPTEYGGQDLPWILTFALQEMWQGANMSFGLCPLLNQGAVEAILSHGSEEQKQDYLEKLISGEWTGTMNLTEPQAGSDLSAIRSKAAPQEDGTYKIFGQKIYITYGEHDFTDNIIHLVLARTPNAPEGVRGISLFIVPKILADGTRNDVICTGLEHKLGIHASPTCTMQYGDQGGAVGYLVGEENHGLKYMFTMMNNARLSVGLQGVAIAERAYQHALAYAKDRVQGTSLTDKSQRVAIADHPDIKRMLLSMSSKIEAFRALTLEAGLFLDLAEKGDKAARARADLLTPIVKACATDMAMEATSTGVQIHGGMGFVEETGAAQYFRDARILPIYEGTNGIQASDLAFRKTILDGGKAVKEYIKEIEALIRKLDDTDHPALLKLHNTLDAAMEEMNSAWGWIIAQVQKDMNAVAASSYPYLQAFGILAGGYMMTRQAVAASNAIKSGSDNTEFLEQKIRTALFYATHELPKVRSYVYAAKFGTEPILNTDF